ncbi:class I SAM-dependent DNA methyltransferase [Rothia dentocariosa]|uniref:class I SAM-dependent DNA methyltransferase n=3 Tax=Rothia dentocariosa TaxID=2047 RepID=UPI00069F3A24|nr:DNA methyltransferase [Rothia dentocariosa]
MAFTDERDEALELLKTGEIEPLFELLGWDEPTHADLTYDNGSTVFIVQNIAELKGVRVWLCRSDTLPSNEDQLGIDRELAKTNTHRLCVYVSEGAGGRQMWRWPSASSSRLTRHEYTPGNSKDEEALLSRLALLYLEQDDFENLTVLRVLDRIRQGFDIEARHESRVASKQMARLFGALEKASMAESDISQTMARLLFVMFGDDTNMWGEGVGASFERYLNQDTNPDGSDIAEKLEALFEHLDKKPEAGQNAATASYELRGFAYVNGGIFANPVTIPASVGKEFRDGLLEASATDWSKVSPAIFGSMFQSVRDAETRRAMGEHYTSEEDVLKTLNPLFLDELRGEYQNALGKSDEGKRLRNLRERLANIRFMDPACGCGNFIIIAYRELRKLEIDVMLRLRDLGVLNADAFVLGESAVSEKRLARLNSVEPLVTIDSFYGIEIDSWPAAIARTAMFLVERQIDQKMSDELGYAPVRLPLRQSAHIYEGDALRTDWRQVLPVTPEDTARGVVTYIAGNPPFSGQGKKDPEQTESLKTAWGTDYTGYLDFATGWYRKASRFFAPGPGTEHVEVPGEFAFVSTNSITQGQPVPDLFSPLIRDGWKIRFAYRTFPWQSEASGKAAVHCVIIGFARSIPGEDFKKRQRIFEYSWQTKTTEELTVTTGINAYLLDAPQVFVTKQIKPLSSQLPPTYFGSKPVDGGNLIVEPEDYDEVMTDPIAAKYVRPYRQAKELISGADRWCLWLIGITDNEVFQSPLLLKRLESVSEMRLKSSKRATQKLAESPHLFGEIHQPLENYVGIPRVVSERRPWFTARHLNSDVISGDANFMAVDPDGFLFSVISSSMFITWQKAIGGSLESRLRFANTIVWNNLPLPPVSEDLRARIIAAGKKILAAREAIEERAGERVGLDKMYASLDDMDPALRKAHEELDLVVDVAFGASRPCTSNNQRISILIDRYLELTGAAPSTPPVNESPASTPPLAA